MCQASFVSILLLRFNKMEASTPELADSKHAPEQEREAEQEGWRDGGQNNTATPLSVYPAPFSPRG